MGCKPKEEIRHYRVLKDEELLKVNGPKAGEAGDAGTFDYRMLTATIPRGEQAWFYRLSGPAEEVAAQADAFRAFTASTHFSDDDKPSWTLPDGWREKPGTELRYATIEIGAARNSAEDSRPLEISITLLPRNDPDLDSYTLSNLNRWRGQLGLQAATLRQMRDSIERVKLDDGEAAIFDLLGHKPSDNMSRAPFARAAASSDRARGEVPERPAAAPSAAPQVKYETPQGWTPAPAGGLRKAAFMVADGKQSAEVTIVSLPLGSGTLLQNVNRWRDQVGLEALSQDEVDRSLSKMEIAGLPGNYIEVIGPREAILGVLVSDANATWYFKLKGSIEIAQRERANFEAFVRSVRFVKPNP